MNKWQRITILFAGLMFLPWAVLADNGDWYVAADVGQSRLTGGDIKSSFGPVIRSTDTAIGYRWAAGYQVTSYWRVEGSYIDLGQVTGNGAIVFPSGGVTCGLPCEYSYNENAKLKAHGWAIAISGAYPINDRWSVFARAGAIDARSELDAHYTPIPPWAAIEQPFDTSSAGTSWDNTYGFGVNWSFTDSWSIRFNWDRYSSLGDNGSVSTFSVNLTSLGIVYRF